MTPSRLTAGVMLIAGAIVLAVNPASARVHEIRQGESLWTLSKKYQVSQEAIARANGLKLTSTLRLGQKLCVPSGKTPYSANNRTGFPRLKKPAAVVSKRPIRKYGTLAASTPLRAEPSASSKMIAVLKPGMRVGIAQTKWHWHEIRTPSGARGWVGDYLVKGVRPIGHAKSNKKLAKKYSNSHKKRICWTSRKTRFRPGVGNQSVAKAEIVSGTTESVRTAMNYLGSRYRYGGSSRGGFDCSGFTMYVYKKHGINLPHSSSAQFRQGTPVSKDELRPGDLVFFSRGSRGVGHVGVYAGNGKFVHASNPRKGVRIDSLNSGSYARKYRGARRIN